MGKYYKVKTNLRQLAVVLACTFCSIITRGAVLYVDLNSTNPTPPFSGWARASTDIQSAVDASSDGDIVLVSDGIYAVGGRAVYGTLTNRVSIDRAITVQSVNGAGVTFIMGMQAPGGTNGPGAIRCAYVTNGAVLSGFTLTNGGTLISEYLSRSGGGAWCEPGALVANSVLTGNSANMRGGGVYGGTLSNCTLAANWSLKPFSMDGAGLGGGASVSTLINCMLVSNLSYDGGAAESCTLTNCALANNKANDAGGATSGGRLNHCTLISNTAAIYGGGAYTGTLTNCTLIGNTASYGGGAYLSTLDNCTLSTNFSLPLWYGPAAQGGGGALGGTLNNCTLMGNAAASGGGTYNSFVQNSVLLGNKAGFGGGASGGTLNNCTIVLNSSIYTCGGAASANLTNCIIYYNTTGNLVDNYIYAQGPIPNAPTPIQNCCTTPLPMWSFDNITNEPMFVDSANRNFHLQSYSPCINSGINSSVTLSNDFDGNPRIKGGTMDIGAYEYQAPTTVLSYAWLQRYHLPTDGSADFIDSDHDGMNNWQEWIAGADPTNSASVLKMMAPTNGQPGLVVSWQSVDSKMYFLQRSSNLVLSPAFSTLRSNIHGSTGTTAFTDATATNSAPYFYRVGVQQ